MSLDIFSKISTIEPERTSLGVMMGSTLHLHFLELGDDGVDVDLDFRFVGVLGLAMEKLEKHTASVSRFSSML